MFHLSRSSSHATRKLQLRCSASRQHISRSQTIEKEWKHLPSAPSTTNCCTNKQHYKAGIKNLPLNRYQDVLPLEKTRVRLKNSAYINANYIRTLPSFQCIATQAPLPQSFTTFWEMVWEKQVKVIVMLSRFIEKRKVKAHRYWPSEENAESFGDTTVLLEQVVEVSKEITIYRLVIIRGDESRKLVHLHYTGWPDFGVPSSTGPIRQVRSLMEGYLNELQASDPSTACSSNDPDFFPVVVHCSAGIGRAGTFLSYVAFCELHKSGVPLEEISVSDIVSSLRKERMCMVQTKCQYEFLYQLVDDEMAAESTEEIQDELKKPISACGSSSSLSSSTDSAHSKAHSFLRSTQCGLGNSTLSLFTS